MNKQRKEKKCSAKRKIRILERVNHHLCESLEFQKEQITRQHRIIRKLGSKDGYEFLDKYEAIEVESKENKPKIYGDYITISDEMFDDEMIKMCKTELTESLARAMMDVNAVQFIVKGKGDESFHQFNTVTAKLYVVPWYEMVKTQTKETTEELKRENNG